MAAGAHSISDEVPQVDNELIPLPHLIERVTAQAYNDLAGLAETLPSHPDLERKRHVVDYVLQTRRQLLKLLVLVRWSGTAQSVLKSRNIIGFLARQNWEFEHTINELTLTKSILAGARVRNSDLPTAISVLTHGTYTSLPTSLTDAFRLPPTLPDSLALRTLSELDGILRWRLGALDRVPLPLAQHGWHIADGRVRFRLPGLWEATLTYSGDEHDKEAEWYLLTVEFLFKVRDARGVWAGAAVGAMKEHIVELCNRELAWRREAAEEGVEGLGAVAPGDAPLERGYAFLQRLALRYQLEAVYEQAARLAATAWSGHLRVQRLNNQTEISLEYWPPPKQPTNSAPAAPAPPPITGKLVISLAPAAPSPPTAATASAGARPPTPSTSAARAPPPLRSARERALDEVMAKVAAVRLGGQAVAEVDAGAGGDPGKAAETEDVPQRLQMVWVADDVPDEVRAELDLDLTDQLDLAALLDRVTKAHARAALEQIFAQLTSELGPDELELVDPAAAASTSSDPSPAASVPAAPYIRARLHGQQAVRLSIPPGTGRLEFTAEGEVGADREKRLRSFAEKADRDRRLVADAVQRVKSSTLLDEVDARAAYLGLATTRRIPLRNPDLAKFGANTLGALYVRLPRLPSHYLVLVLNAQGFRFALIAVRDGGDPSQALVIDEIGWLDKEKVMGAEGGGVGKGKGKLEGQDEGKSGFEVTIEELKGLHEYCVKRIASFKVEGQLHARRIGYRTVLPPRQAGAGTEGGAAVPYLVVRSEDLLRGDVGKRVAWPNLAIRCGLVKVDGEDVIRTTLHARFHDLSLVGAPEPDSLPASVKVDVASGVVSLSTDQLDGAVATFLSAFGLVVRAVVMARHRRGVEAEAKKGDGQKVDAGGGEDGAASVAVTAPEVAA